jgi:hypothetical protein
MAVVFTELFEGAADGVTLSTVNTGFDVATSTGTGNTRRFSTTVAHEGTRSGWFHQVAAGTSFGTWIFPDGIRTTGGVCLYGYLPSLPVNSLCVVALTRTASASNVARDHLAIQPTGAVRMYVGVSGSGVATSTVLIPAGSWFRLEWKVDTAVPQQSCQIYVGANVDGTVPDQTITGACGVNAIDAFSVGIPRSLTANAAGYDIYLDAVQIDDTDFPGRYSTAQNLTGTGSLTGTLSTTSTGQKGARGTGGVSGSLTLAGTGTKTGYGSGSVWGALATASTGRKNGSGSGALSGLVGLSGAGAKAGRGTGSLTGVLSATAAGGPVSAVQPGEAGSLLTGVELGRFTADTKAPDLSSAVRVGGRFG